MRNVVELLLSLIDENVIWLYALLALIILWYVRALARARRERVNTVFTVEREVAAHNEGRALSSIGLVLVAAIVVTALKYYVMPSIDLKKLVEPTPTVEFVVPTAAPTETPALLPTPTSSVPTLTPRPVATATPAVSPTPRPTAQPPAACPDPGIVITQPAMGARVLGRVAIRGTADPSDFQFYKIEFGPGEAPTGWTVINDIHRVPVRQGVLEEWDTAGLANGTYWLRLTVVDHTGNFPPPCEVRVVVQN